MNQSAQGAARFGPLGIRRASDRVAEVIRRTIVDGEFRPGDKLPTERGLAARFQVTRNTIREALRQLEQLRLVSIRQGSGVVVQDLLASAGVELLSAVLDEGAMGGRLARDVFEVRAVIGQAVLAFAIERFEPSGLAALGRAVDAFVAEAEAPAPDPRRLAALDFDVHTSLVRSSGNVALVLLFNTLRSISAQLPHLLESLVAEPARMAAEYRRTVAALAQGDRRAARRAFARVFAAQVPGPAPKKNRTSRRAP